MKTREEIAQGLGKRHILLLPDGGETPLLLEGEEKAVRQAAGQAGDEALAAYILADELKHPPRATPPSIRAMRRLELVDYEPAADAGHFRFYPKGSLIYDLLIDWADEIALRRLRAMKIETPLIYDWSQPDIREQGESFHERHYTVTKPGGSGREWIFRFAGDFGLFRMVRDARFSYRHLPVRIYELSKSFRYERSGELSGLNRLRAFTLPDIHCFTRDIEEGWREYGELYRHYDDLAKGAEVEYAIVFRIVEDFYRQHRERILELLRYSRRPAFIELLSGMKHYWVVKHEFQSIDSVGGTCQLSTVQLDVVDAERYGITYTDEHGEEQGCIICHSSIGSIERWIYSVLEHALRKEKPMLPVWLSPVQVRLLPVSDSYNGYALEACRKLRSFGVRCDVDDRSLTLGKKISLSRKEWIPYEAVIGEREVKGAALPVHSRRDGQQRPMTVDAVVSRVKDDCSGRPEKALWLSEQLSRRPIFRG